MSAQRGRRQQRNTGTTYFAAGEVVEEKFQHRLWLGTLRGAAHGNGLGAVRGRA